MTAAIHYAAVRADLRSHQGKVLAPLDLMIAAHAASASAIFVTNDRAFEHVSNLRLAKAAAGEQVRLTRNRPNTTQSHKTLAFPVP